MVAAVADLVLDARRIAQRLDLEAVALEQGLHVVADGLVVVDDEDANGGKLDCHLLLLSVIAGSSRVPPGSAPPFRWLASRAVPGARAGSPGADSSATLTRPSRLPGKVSACVSNFSKNAQAGFRRPDAVHAGAACRRARRTRVARLTRSRRGEHRAPPRCRNAVSVRGVAQPGSAPGSGPGSRRFKSSRPDFIHFARAVGGCRPPPAARGPAPIPASLRRRTPASERRRADCFLPRPCDRRREGQPSGAYVDAAPGRPGRQQQVPPAPAHRRRRDGQRLRGAPRDAGHDGRAQVPPPRVHAARGARAALPPGGARVGADPEPARRPGHGRRPDRRRATSSSCSSTSRARRSRRSTRSSTARAAGSRTPTRSTTRCRSSTASRPRTRAGIVHRDLKPDNVMITTDAQGRDRSSSCSTSASPSSRSSAASGRAHPARRDDGHARVHGARADVVAPTPSTRGPTSSRSA